MYLTNDLINWADWLNICTLRVMDIHWSYQNLLFLAGIVWHRLSANQIVRCVKLKKLRNYMRYQIYFLLPLKLQKISSCFGLCRKILLANQFAGFFTIDLFDLLILIPGLHCYIVLVFILDHFEILYWKVCPSLFYRTYIFFDYKKYCIETSSLFVLGDVHIF